MSDVLTNLFLIYVGFFVGVVTGLLGLGGGWIISPTLNFLGFQGIVGVGTSLTQMVGTTIFSSRIHLKNKTAQPKLAIAIALPLLAGTLTGFFVLSSLQALASADYLLRSAYILLLVAVGINWLRPRKIHVKPPVTAVPILPLVCVAYITGIVSGALGVGGGFMMVPFTCWLLGLPVATAVGTVVLAMIFSSTAGASAYIYAGNVDISAAAFLLIGSLAGTNIGSKLAAKIPDKQLRQLFSLILLATATSLGFMQFGQRYIALGLIFIESIVFLAAVIQITSKQRRQNPS